MPKITRDEMYFAREDVAFIAWERPRKEAITITLGYEAVISIARSAFNSGVRFAENEIAIQETVATEQIRQTLVDSDSKRD